MSSFAKNIFTLSAGNIIAQVISIGLMPVITRIYEPDHFGVFAYYMAIVMVVFPVSTLRFNSAVMLPKKEEEAAGLLVLSCLSVIIISLFVIPMSLLVLDYFGWHGGLLGNMVWIIPLGVLIQGLFQSFNFWAIRNKLYKQMSVAAISESASDKGFVLAWVWVAGSGALGLILGRIVGPLVSLLIVLFKSVLPSYDVIRQAVHWGTLKPLIIRYKDFPLFSSWSFLASALSRELPTILLALLFSPLAAGLYGLGVRVMNMPMMLIGDSVAKAFLQKAADERDDIDLLERKVRKLMIYAFILILPFAIDIVIFGEEVFSWLFGARWREAGSIVQVLMTVFVCLFLYRILSVLFDVYEKQQQRLFIDVIMLLARSIPLLLLSYADDTYQNAIVLMAFASIVVYILSFRYLFGLINLNYVQFLRVLAGKVIIFIPFVSVMLFLSITSTFQGVQLMLLIGFLTGIQYLVVILSDKKLKQTVLKAVF